MRLHVRYLAGPKGAHELAKTKTYNELKEKITLVTQKTLKELDKLYDIDNFVELDEEKLSELLRREHEAEIKKNFGPNVTILTIPKK